jgi:hypothetical protein
METHFASDPPYRSRSEVETAPGLRGGAGARVWAGAVLLMAGLGLIVLGGCFLYGVLELLRLAGADSVASWVLQVVLYVVAFICFAGAAVQLTVGSYGLVRILMESSAKPPPDA